MTRAYKACTPLETIANIRTKLFELGFFLKESHYNNSIHFNACNVKLYNEGVEHLSIGANGKGTTLPYSLASAYAEFMERLQNNILFDNQYYASKKFLSTLNASNKFKSKIEKDDLAIDFLHDPEERNILTKDVVRDNSYFLQKLLPFIENGNKELESFIKDTLDFNELTCIPFGSVFSESIAFLPIELIHAACGSTGMCAGNTKEEALIQGFCEIFERYVGRRIYFEKITPPDIPKEQFKGTSIHNIIKELEEKFGYNIKIKDCSLCENMPVIGILVIDQKNKKYNFHLGSSLVIHRALERCLTEIYQNPDGIIWNDINYDSITQEEGYSEEFIFFNGSRIFEDGSGLWPLCILKDTPSYPYSTNSFFTGKTDCHDLQYILAVIKKLGHEVYVRDVSFLNFPSYYIIIPGLSQFPIKSYHYIYLSDTIKAFNQFRNIHLIKPHEFNCIVNELNSNYQYVKMLASSYQKNFLYQENWDLNNLDLELFMFMLNYRVENYEKSIFYLEQFLKDKDLFEYEYYYTILDYAKLRSKGIIDIEIHNILKNIHPNEIEEVICDLNDPSKIFNNYDWPSCFDCDKCKIEKDCRFFESLRLLKKVKHQQKNNLLNHTKVL